MNMDDNQRTLLALQDSLKARRVRAAEWIATEIARERLEVARERGQTDYSQVIEEPPFVVHTNADRFVFWMTMNKRISETCPFDGGFYVLGDVQSRSVDNPSNPNRRTLLHRNGIRCEAGKDEP